MKVQAAGILHHHEGKVLLIRRSATCDSYPGYWAFPGGKIDAGESAINAAIRESYEEVNAPFSEPVPIGCISDDSVDFHCFELEGYFEPTINGESDAVKWVDIDALPHPIMPNAHKVIVAMFSQAKQLTDFDVMNKMRMDELPSPQQFGNVWLFDIRVTGTGLAVRGKDDVTYRGDHFLSTEFIQRCSGIPVLLTHPKNNNVLDSKSYKEQNIGSSMMPFIRGSDVRTIARIYDDTAARLMMEYQLSTSPGVTLGADNDVSGGILIEGKPVYVDHIAVCTNGVWDKGAPDGVKVDNLLETDMDLIELKAFLDAKFGETNEQLKGLSNRMDSFEASGETKDDSVEDKLSGEDGTKHVTDASDEKNDSADVANDSADDADTNKMDSTLPTDVKLDSAANDKLLREMAEFRNWKTAQEAKSAAVIDLGAVGKAQYRADSLAMSLGMTAPQYTQGEAEFSFRQRLVDFFKTHSPRWKDTVTGQINDPATFTNIESDVYNDAAEYAQAPIITEGTLHYIESKDEHGRVTRTPTRNSDPSAWMAQFEQGAVFSGRLNTGA